MLYIGRRNDLEQADKLRYQQRKLYELSTQRAREASKFEVQTKQQAEEKKRYEERIQQLEKDLQAKADRKLIPTANASAVTAPVHVAGSDVWAQLRQCEAGGDYTKDTGNGYYGAYQFSAATWLSMGTGYAFANLAPPSVQDSAAQALQARSGWGQWPACAKKLGLL